MTVDCPFCGSAARGSAGHDCPICGSTDVFTTLMGDEPSHPDDVKDLLELHYSMCGRHAIRLLAAMDGADEPAARAAVACIRDEAVAVRRLRRTLHLAG